MNNLFGTSYCKIHNTHPLDDEPCWACIRVFGGNLNPSENCAAENQEHRKLCRIDKVTLCVQHPDTGCGCDPCVECEIRFQAERS